MKLFNDYKNKNVLTVTPHDIAYELINTYTNVVPLSDKYYGEATLDIIAHSSLDSFPANTDGIIRALYYLNRKIEAARKTFSYWDAYQIRGTLTDRDQVLGQLAAIPANSSVVSNLRNPFSWLNPNGELETVYQGDVFIKDYEDRIHLIHTLSSGFFVPDSNTTKSGNTFTINYNYQSDNNTTEPVPVRLELSNPQWKGYNFYVELDPNGSDSYEFEFDDEDNPIYPVIKIYTEDGEQVFLDQSYCISQDEEEFEFNNPTQIKLRFEVK